MIEIRVTEHLPAPTRRVWDEIGDPASLASWHPAIEASPVEGDTRRCTLANGAQITERVLSRDDRRMSYTYAITGGALPVRDYVATLSVAEAGDGAEVTWEGRFETSADAAEMRGLVEGVYRAGLAALQERFAS